MEKEYIKEYQIVFRRPRKPGLRITKPGTMPISHHRWPLSKPHLWIQIVQLNHHTENQRVLPEPLIFPSLRKKTYFPFSSLEWFYAAPAFCFTSCQFKNLKCKHLTGAAWVTYLHPSCKGSWECKFMAFTLGRTYK